ncbi:hypothetical protein O6H91_04G063000 [Diphasiastrum complanatum]|uniref:Uncharacterized protein n=1 Tax=Diphasiastrum complanatum TaxID=34168 RepID=A0ACC2DXJ0_DIPCM|nr:hypothetical protein O6H91_04G063000 [Diphasiastrum complanatum]
MAAAEEDAAKKDTDCVYFLASPLTCKKGNDCEFRHSENARMNPRDCWYWLHSKCLNRDCAFRHPVRKAFYFSNPAFCEEIVTLHYHLSQPSG